jgi:autotransporter-associated beta strand protein
MSYRERCVNKLITFLYKPFAVGVSLILSTYPTSSQAQQSLTWDSNGPSTGTGGTGAWNTSSSNWWNNTTFQQWNNLNFDNAIFGGTSGTVTLEAPISVHNLNFSASGYTLNGSELTLGGPKPTITINPAVTTTINSLLAGSGGLIKSGGGTLILTSDNTGFSGVTTITSGTLQIDNPNALGTSTAASDLVLNKGSTFHFNVNYTHDYMLMGNSVSVAGGAATWSGSPTLTASTIVNFIGSQGTLSGNLADTGANILSTVRNGSGRMTLSGNNSYTGTTTITQGTLQLASGAALSSNSNLIFNGAVGTGGTIELTSAYGDFSRTLGSGAGQVQWAGDGGFLSSGSRLAVNIGGVGAQLVWGSGGFVPTGNRLILGTSSNDNLDFQNNVDLSGGIRTVQAEGGNITGHARMNGVLSGSGGLNLVSNSSGILELTAANTYTDGTTLTSGTLVVGTDSNLGAAAGSLTFNGGTLENTNAFTTGRTITLNAGGGTFQTDANLEVSGPMSGTGGLNKTGSGTLTLTNANTHSGGTTISAGTLQIGNGGATGSISGNITDNDLLAFNRSDATVFGGAISGAGGLEQRGTGTLTLIGENTYTGGTTISAGTLRIGK